MKEPISGRIRPDILEDVRKVMKIEHRSFNNLLETSLKVYCESVLIDHAKKSK